MCVCLYLYPSIFVVDRFVFFFVDLETGGDDLGFTKWIEELQGKPGLWVLEFVLDYPLLMLF